MQQAAQLVSQKVLQAVDSSLLPFNHIGLDGRSVNSARIVQEMQTPPFFADSKLVVVSHAPFFTAKKATRKDDDNESDNEETLETTASEQFSAVFKNPTPGVITVFQADSVNMRLSLSALVKKCGVVYNFSAVKRNEAVQDAQFLLREALQERNLTMHPTTQQKFLGLIGVDEKTPFVRKLLQELDKLAAYKGYKGVVKAEDIDLLISRSAEAKVFDVTDALSLRDARKALLALQQLWQDGEEPFMVLSMLSRHFRQLLLGKELLVAGFSPDDAAVQLGGHPFVTGKILQAARAFDLADLKSYLHSCFEIDHAAKTGQGEPVLGMEMLIVRACKRD